MTEVRMAKRTIIMATMMLLVFGAACTKEKPPASEPTPTFVVGGITPLPGTGVAMATIPFTFTESAATPTEPANGSVGPFPTVEATATVSAPTESTTYTIQVGDWLSKIAQRFGVTTQALMAANPGLDPNKIYPGQAIIIPAAGAPVPTPSTRVASIPAPSITPGPTPTGAVAYTVQKGEWPAAIARKFGISMQALQTANPSVVQGPLYPGQVLIIPGGNSPSGQPRPNRESDTAYVVRAGDTLNSIAVRFGRTAHELQTANNLPSVDAIYAGQTLIIP